MTVGTFTALLSAPVAAWHGYLWHRIFRATGLPARWQRWGGALFAALGVIVLLAVSRPRWLRSDLKALVCAVGFPWIGFAILLACALGAGEIVHLAHRIRRPAVDPERRFALRRLVGGVAALSGGGVALAGAREALALTVQRVRVPLRRLPPSLSGLRLAQVSDLHFGAAVGVDYLSAVIDRVNALDPDLVVITGDLVDGSVARLKGDIARLRDLRSRLGVFFVTGNHEYYSGAVEWVDHLRSIGVQVLANERVSVGAGGASFDLAGVHDRGAHLWGIGHRHDLPAALAGRDPSRALVLLAHQPVSVIEAARHGVDLQLSGHTHGGQIWPLRFLIYIDQPFVDGLNRLKDTWIYVSRGAGYWGPPMRVGAPPEIAEVTLVSSEG